MRAAVICRVVSAAGALFAAGAGAAQDAHKLQFEVASIKPSAIDTDQFHQLAKSGQAKVGAQIHGDRVDYIYMSRRQLVAEAYRVKPYQVVCPDWCTEGRFDVMARMPAGYRKEDAPLMLQSLLVERFKLAVHRESRQENVAALVIGPGGPRLIESPPEVLSNSGDERRPQEMPVHASQKKDNVSSPSQTMGTASVRFTVDPTGSSVRLVGSRVSMGELARLLTNFDVNSGRPVVDMTGLAGEYEIVVDIPLSANGRAIPIDEAPRPVADASEPGGSPEVANSLKILGLQLKNTKAPVEYLVVDHANKNPTEN